MEKSKGKPSWWKVALCGTIIGLVNGFFGGGGGMICVPFLENVLKMETKYAHATTLCVIFPLSLASSIVYINKNYHTNYYHCFGTFWWNNRCIFT